MLLAALACASVTTIVGALGLGVIALLAGDVRLALVSGIVICAAGAISSLLIDRARSRVAS